MRGPAGAGASAHVVVADLTQPVLTDGDHHHLCRVLRLRTGDVVTATDGAGSWRVCRFGADAVLEADGDVAVEERPRPQLTVAFALTKGDKPELVVQKLTELGIDRILPMAAARSVVRWDDAKARAQVDRLTKIAREALMQSRGVWLPTVGPVTDLAGLVAAGPVALAHMDGDPPSLACPTVAVGPEGGWSPDELSRDLPQVRLGPTVLRAETAAVAVATVLAALRAGTVREIHTQSDWNH